MKVRKLFAGIAAAATMLGGLALGATTASAEPAGQTLTLTAGEHGVVNGHTFKYVELAKYVTANSAEIQTVADRATVVAAIKTATTKDVPDNVDPLVWAQSGDLNGTGNPLFGDNSAFPWGNNAASRQLANALKSYVEDNGTEVTANAEPYAINNLDGGLYVLIDTTEDATATEKSLPIIVGTANKAFSFNGQVVVKNQKTNVPPTKTVTGDTNGTVSVGDTLHYSIEGMVPSTTDQADDYTYVFKDYASAGLNIETAKTNIKVYVGDSTTALADSEYTVSPENQTVTGNGTDATFTVTLNKSALDKLQDHAGEKLTVKYAATVTDDAKKNPVTNSAEVVNGGNASGKGSTVTLNSNKFSFNKVWKDGSAAKGAKFEVYDSNNKKVAELQNGKDGNFEFSGLKNGTYTVKETKVADGAQNVTGTFTVKLTWNKDKNNTDVEFKDSLVSDPYDLVKNDKGTIKVTNVKSVTQLPLTGAAGITMFLVLAVALGGVAFVTYSKSRSTARALRA